MSTPENTPEVPEPPRYGQRLPEGAPADGGQAQGGQPGPGQYGQPGPAAPSSYGQYGQGQVPPVGQSPYGEAPQGYGAAPQQGGGPYGQPGQANYGYQQPMPGTAGFGAPTGPLVRPKELNIAFWLILAAGALTLISGLLLLVLPSTEIQNAMQDALSQDPALQEQMEAAGINSAALVSMIKTVGLVVMIVGAALYALIAFFIRKGSNGARITGTVLAAISLFGLTAGDPLSLVTILLGVAGIVFAWLKPSSAYIAARKAQKSAGFGR
jgi:hypothetical protein